jgi:hypothetical protein
MQPDMPAMSPRPSGSLRPARWQSNSSGEPPICMQVPANPGGCLTVNGGIACGDEAEPVRQALNAHRTAGVALLRRRFEQAKAQHDLPKDSDPAALARFLAAVVYGMAVLASGGASRKEMEQVIRTAMKAWPATAEGRQD